MQAGVEDALGAQQHDPGEGADEDAEPEGQHDAENHHRAMTLADMRHGVGNEIAGDDRDDAW